ncbi:MAG: 16S rRNA (guanine(527)-N(7))-methyltransferase RsmG [Desulfobacterales bacterium]|jgi:16S rRNA (guanine527-N7)-methyltransferase|nr:16S rRNA (guanine(527)-N(7))-methyltransferase RsmG [Desulfobacterales bacterium]
MKIKTQQKPIPHNRTGLYHPGDMDNLLNRCGIEFSPMQLDQLWTYHNLLRQYNLDLNLTRIHNFLNMVLKLYVDSILPGRLIDLPTPLLDLGSGPGMPGIPLKIAYPHLEIFLAESRRKRVDFLEMAVNRLKIEHISVIGTSISSRFETPVQGVITRAVEDITTTLDRVSGCLISGGLAVFMKGPGCDNEIREASVKFQSKFRLMHHIDYHIPHTSQQRRLIVFQRIDEPLWEKRSKAMDRYPFSIIESEQNKIFKDLKKLLTGRGIKKYQMALISGSKQVMEILRDFPERCEAWITANNQPPPSESPAYLKWYQLASPLFKIIDAAGTEAPILLVKTPLVPKWSPEDGLPEGTSMLIPFQDPENVGAVIRTAVAFGVKNIILLAESAHPYHPKSIRASGGAVLRASISEGPALKDIPKNLPIIALSPEGTNISGCEFPNTFAFLPGIEGSGLPDHLRARAYSIPIHKEVESLNAATAAAIALYIWSQKQPIP